MPITEDERLDRNWSGASYDDGGGTDAAAQRRIAEERKSFGVPAPSSANADSVDDMEFERRAFDDSEERRWRAEQWQAKRDAEDADKGARYG